MATRAVVAGERLRRHCPGRELASTARLPAPVSWSVRAAGAGRPEVPARPGPASCPRAGRAAPRAGLLRGLLGQPPPTPKPPSTAFPRTADQSPSLPIAGSGVLRPDPDCASSSAFSGVNPAGRVIGWLRSQESGVDRQTSPTYPLGFRRLDPVPLLGSPRWVPVVPGNLAGSLTCGDTVLVMRACGCLQVSTCWRPRRRRWSVKARPAPRSRSSVRVTGREPEARDADGGPQAPANPGTPRRRHVEPGSGPHATGH